MKVETEQNNHATALHVEADNVIEVSSMEENKFPEQGAQVLSMGSLTPTSVDELRAGRAKEAAFFREMLNGFLREDDKSLVRRVRMGSTSGYVGAARMRWVRTHLMNFTQLPLLKKFVDPETKQLRYDEETIELLEQRNPDLSRETDMVLYLLTHPNRKFPSLLAVVQEDWIDSPDAPEWVTGKDGKKRASRTSLPIEFLDSDGRVAIIDFGKPGVRVYVIDGGHRLLAIIAAIEFVQKDEFTIKVGRKSRTINRNDFAQEYAVELEELDKTMHSLPDEEVAIEYIPAVLEGETREEARARTRSLFVHVNKSMRPPTKGEQVLLDEDDGFAIVARRIAMGHHIFRHRGAGDRVTWKASSISPTGQKLIPGANLRDLVQEYLGVKPPYQAWFDKSRTINPRPKAGELDAATAEMATFLDKVMLLRPYVAIASGDELDQWREFENGGKGHLLTRPLGLSILARAVAALANAPASATKSGEKAETPRMTLENVFKKVIKYDNAGGFENVGLPKSAWFGITYSPERGGMQMRNRELAIRLLRYLIDPHSMSPEGQEELRQDFGRARAQPKEDGSETYFSFDGASVESLDDVKLPMSI